MLRIPTLAIAALLAAAGPAGATGTGTATGTLQLKGAVFKNCSIAIQEAAATLDIVGGETARQVATVSERCNSKLGYEITIVSSNSGVMRADGATAAYTLVYDGQVRSLGTPWTITRGDRSNKATTAVVGVTLPSTPNAVAGTYTDTVTIQIAPK
ncbi:hypothetical protein [Arenibaculum sp.]|jgi:spore coat protein U-like protein|uniref:hypothetical protein n=1 Tax=Arenibaculum sp. TaxID=2865862 RepID=UPI002E14DA5C|nr:hypothetical protein [Arenibaculum sp.]